MPSVTFRLSDELHARLLAALKRLRMGKSTFVREALERALDETTKAPTELRKED